MTEFERQKNQRLEHVDLSRKGSIDSALLETVTFINASPNYFTTSSCSGRIILFENVCTKVQKKGCKWLHVSHDCVFLKDLEAALNEVSEEAVLKFEPMVMHVQCRSLEDAQKLHQIAVASGFRNSGITVGTKGKVMIAVRSTHCLEVPLSSKGQVLVSEPHLKHLVDTANAKMEENMSRIDRFYENLQGLTKVAAPSNKRTAQKCPKGTHEAKNKQALSTEDGTLQEDVNNLDLRDSFMFDNT